MINVNDDRLAGLVCKIQLLNTFYAEFTHKCGPSSPRISEIMKKLTERIPSEITAKDSEAEISHAIGLILIESANKGVKWAVDKITLNFNADVNAYDFLRRTPLMHACRSNHAIIVNTLLGQEKIKPNEPDAAGHTPLMHASKSGSFEAIKTLLNDKRVNVRLQSDSGTTAIMYASKRGHVNVVSILSSKSDLTIKNKKGETAFSLADKENIALVSVLEEALLKQCYEEALNSDQSQLNALINKYKGAGVLIAQEGIDAIQNMSEIEKSIRKETVDQHGNGASPRERLLCLIAPSYISNDDEKRILRLFTIFSCIKNMTHSYAEAMEFQQTAEQIFNFIETSNDRNLFVSNYLRAQLTSKDVELLCDQLDISSKCFIELWKNAIPDLFILLIHRYQANGLLKNIGITNGKESANLCKKIINTVAIVEAHLSNNFSYSIGFHDNLRFKLTSAFTREQAAARKYAFALTFNNPHALEKIARNRVALAGAYNQFIPNQNVSYLRPTHGNVQRVNMSDNEIAHEDFASIDGSCSARTTALAGLALARKKRISEQKEFHYELILVHIQRNKSTDELAILKRFEIDIRSKINRVFTGIIAVASQYVERGGTKSADQAFDIINILACTIPLPIIEAAFALCAYGVKSLHDKNEVKLFVKMSEKLCELEHRVIINKELASYVLKMYAEDLLRLVKSAPDKEAAYRSRSEKVTTQLEESILFQLAKSEIKVDSIHLGIVLFQGFEEMMKDLDKKKPGWRLS
ncbi:MAG: ankyrin repeat domain-containing protein [Gammaproteobacteria bacterium]